MSIWQTSVHVSIPMWQVWVQVSNPMWQGLNWKIRLERNKKWSKRIFPFTVLLLVGFFNCLQFALPSPAFFLSVIVSLRAWQSGWWFFCVHFVCIVLVDSWVLYVQGVSFALSSRFVGRFMILYYFHLWCSVFIDDIACCCVMCLCLSLS